MELSDLEARAEAVRQEAGRPITVGISGFGGAGKSSLAEALAGRLGGCVRMRGDDFLDPVRSHQRSPDWDGVERDRLTREVLLPFREGTASTFRRFDWSRRALSAPEPLPQGRFLIVDLIGLFHPDTDDVLDLKLWCDVELDQATAWGKARDARWGRNHARLWDEVWVPNERDFAASFRPRHHADLLVPALQLDAFAVS